MEAWLVVFGEVRSIVVVHIVTHLMGFLVPGTVEWFNDRVEVLMVGVGVAWGVHLVMIPIAML